MSKKHGKQEPRRGFPWPLFAVAGIVLVSLTAYLLVNNRTPPDDAGIPKLAVDQQMIDFGSLKDFTNKTFSLTVTNIGSGTLRFKEKPYVQVVEGCCPPDLNIGSMTLRPGDSTTVTSSIFMMHPGMDGKHDFAVHLITNDPAQPELVVNVLSNWSQ